MCVSKLTRPILNVMTIRCLILGACNNAITFILLTTLLENGEIVANSHDLEIPPQIALTKQ